MRLIDQDPRWIEHGGRRIGFIFRSPLDPKFYQSCFTTPTPSGVQRQCFEAMFGDDDCYVQGCKSDIAWTFTPAIDAADFQSLTVKPSIDGSAGGLWHGYITNGEIGPHVK